MNKFEELLIEKGIYSAIEINQDDFDEMQTLFKKSGKIFTIDCYCIQCSEMRTFEVSSCNYSSDNRIIKYFNKDEGGFYYTGNNPMQMYTDCRYDLVFQCTKNRQHTLVYDLVTTQKKMIKIGQYPSSADISKGDFKKYKKVLGDKYAEYSRSIGLYSHGIGIGSFVYLRRLIESLVFDKYKEVKEELGTSEEIFTRLEFKDKLEALKAYLPKVLIENKNIYSIVSKGIHELSEDICRDMFPFIRMGIELILDEIIAENEKKEKEIAFKKFVSETTGQLKSL